MKNLVTRILTAGIVMAGVVALHAQDKAVTANVPFNFYLNNKVMPKGVYRVSENSRGTIVSLKTTTAIQAITVSNVEGKSLVETPRLVFHRYGDTYFLAQVWTGHNSMGSAIVRSSHEKELTASAATPGDTVVVALTQ
jgi:hypothetical protein